MPFDPTTAQPVQSAGFDPSTAQPVPTGGFDPTTAKPAQPDTIFTKLSGIADGLNKDMQGAFMSADLNGFGGLVARKALELTGKGIPEIQQKFPGQTDEWYKDKQKLLLNQVMLEQRQKYAQQQQDNAVNIPGTKIDPLAFGAGVVGGADPTYVLGPTEGMIKSLTARGLGNTAAHAVAGAGVHGALSGASDAAYQGADIIDGLKKDYDVKQTLTAAAGGAAFGGATPIVSDFVAGLFKARGTDTLPPERPEGITTPLSGQGLSPEETSQFHQILQTGDEHDIRGFFNGRNTLPPSFADAHEWVQRRDAVNDGSAPSDYADPMFHPEPGAPDPEFHRQAVEDHVARQTADWKNAPDVNVVHGPDELQDPTVRAKAQAEDPEGTGLGFYDAETGKVHLYSGRIHDESTANAVLYHESLGHHGLAQQFGEGLDNTVNTLLKRNVGQFGKDVDEWQKKNPGAYNGDRTRAAEEVLANKANEGALKPSISDAITSHVRNFGRKMGLKLSYSDAEVNHIVGMAHDAVINGKGRDVRSNGFKFMKSEPNKYPVPEDDANYNSRMVEQNPESGTRTVRHMSPDEYHETVGRPAPYDNSVGKLATDIDQNGLKQMPWIKYDKDGNVESQEGRHRVEALKSLGYEQVPVVEHRPAGSTKFMRSDPDDLHQRKLDEIKSSIDSNRANYSKLDDHIDYLDHAESQGRNTGDLIERAMQQQDELRRRTAPANSNKPMSAKDIAEHNLNKADDAYYEHTHGDLPNTMSHKEWKRTREELRKNQEDALAEYKTHLDTGPKFMRASDLKPGDVAHEAYDRLEKDYVPKHVTWDEARTAAQERGLSVGDIRNTSSAGDLQKKVFIYDAAAKEASGDILFLADLQEKGELSGSDQAHLIKTVADFKFVLGRIERDSTRMAQGLNALKAVGFTRNNLLKLKEALKDGETDLDGLADPDTAAKFLRDYKKMMDNDNPKGATTLLTQVTKPYWWQFPLTWRSNMMLSALSTHLKSTMDMATTAGRDLEEKIAAMPAAGVRQLLRSLGLKNVQQGLHPTEVAAHLWGLTRAVLDAQTYKDAGDAFMNGGQQRFGNQNPRIPIVSKVTDAIAAQDSFFRSVLGNANLYALGARKAYTELKAKGGSVNWDDVTTIGATHAQTPTPEMLAQAKELSENTMLLNRSPLNDALDRAKRIRPGMNGVEQLGSFLVNYFTPFVRVQSNALMNQLIRRSPLSFLDPVTKADWAAGGARRDVAIMRTLIGTGILINAWNAADPKNKKLTGEGPENFNKLKEMEASGWSSNSVHENGRYNKNSNLNISLNPFDLHNNTASLVAGVREAYEAGTKGKDLATGIQLTMAAVMHDLVSQTFVNDLGEAYDAFSQKGERGVQKMGQFLGNEAKSFLPNMTNQTARMIDPNAHNTTDSIGDQIKSAIPGMSQSVPIRHTVYGDNAQTGTSPTGIHTWLSNGNGQQETTDPTEKELARLGALTPAAVVTPVQKTINIPKVGKVKLTASQFEDYQKYSGQGIVASTKDLMDDPSWAQMSDADKIGKVKEIERDVKKEVRETLLQKEGWLNSNQLKALRNGN